MATWEPTELANVKLGKAVAKSATAVGVPVFSDHLEEAATVEGVTVAALQRDGFKGAKNTKFVLAGGDATRILIGMGPAAKTTADDFRKGAAMFIRSVAGHEKIAFALDDALTIIESLEDSSVDPAAVLSALSEGLLLGSYRFGVYKKLPEGHAPKRGVTVAVGERARVLAPAMTRARAVSEAVAFARDVVNEPGGTLTPTVFAQRSAERARAAGLKAEIMDEKAIAKARLGGLLAVNQGSVEPPRLLKLTYEPAKASSGEKVALVGKGITFDSGGLSLKPAESMIGMKNDMAGAAAVIATMCALPALGVTTKVVSFTPMTDNMTGGAAQRPGDIYTARNGKTVEVLNTDAEGRLVLGEALVLASEQKPTAIIDLATLTGACVVALGEKIAGLMSNDDELVTRIEDAAKGAGERVWHLPLPEDYRSGLDSKIADLKNIAGRYGGTLTAGLFLREFVGEGIDWAHIDIAGPAFTSDSDGENGVGATGFGVRTLLRLLQDWR
ncbi:MAG: leucyl aminopeptidase [Microthrixaceae bacterium]|nr:leucyl aminopeptidase [Microthrixaceae bacterium]